MCSAAVDSDTQPEIPVSTFPDNNTSVLPVAQRDRCVPVPIPRRNVQMMRELARRPHVEKSGFRWRGTEITRLEALSDAVFGFAITLLVVSLQVPDTFTEMLGLLRGLPAFAASFALLFLVWLNQHHWFRRYGLEDGTTTCLNAILLFVILFFVYPLKFVFQIVIVMILGPAWFPDSGRVHGAVLEAGQQPLMMVVFGAGYVAV